MRARQAVGEQVQFVLNDRLQVRSHPSGDRLKTGVMNRRVIVRNDARTIIYELIEHREAVDGQRIVTGLPGVVDRDRAGFLSEVDGDLIASTIPLDGAGEC